MTDDEPRTVADTRYTASPQEEVWLERLDDLPIVVAMRRLEMGERAEKLSKWAGSGAPGDDRYCNGWDACLDYVRGTE